MRTALTGLLGLLLVGCGDEKQRVEVTYEDGKRFVLEPRNADGTPSALTWKVDASGNFSFWSVSLKDPSSTDPRAQQELTMGRVGPLQPALLPGQGGSAALSGEGVETRQIEFKVENAQWKGVVATPFTFSGTSKLAADGKFVLAPRCAGSGARSNWGCGHKLPTDSSLPLKVAPPRTPFFLGDNCVPEFWKEVTSETWKLEGDKLNVGGRVLPCLKTDENQLVCGETRQMRAPTGNAQGLCGHTVTTIAMPDFDPTDDTKGPQLLIFASANDESITTTDSCYGFSVCYAGF